MPLDVEERFRALQGRILPRRVRSRSEAAERARRAAIRALHGATKHGAPYSRTLTTEDSNTFHGLAESFDSAFSAYRAAAKVAMKMRR